MKTISIKEISDKAGLTIDDLLLIKVYNKAFEKVAKRDNKCMPEHRRQATLILLENVLNTKDYQRVLDIISEPSLYNHKNGDKVTPFWTEAEINFMCQTLAACPYNIIKALQYVSKLLGRNYNSVRQKYYNEIKNNPDKLEVNSFIAITTALLPVNNKTINSDKLKIQ